MLGEPTRAELDVFLRTWQRAIQAEREECAKVAEERGWHVTAAAIKTLLSRDPCVHANTAIEMIDAILKEHPAAQPAPVQGPLSFNCSAGCGACGVKLQDFVTHQTQAQEGDEWVVMETEPQIVSTCCGSPVEVWDERKQDITASVDATPPAAQPAPVQEPVAWVCYGAPGKRDIDFEEADINKLPIGTLLYTTPFTQPAPVQDSAVYGDWDDSDSCGQCGMVNGHSPECRHLYTTPPAQPAVPDAIHHTDLSESLEYIQGWNDCRQAMLEMMK